ncbi:MAG: hydrogenase formation protein HypD [Synergistaceae bacterium]|nr:hydrogenase formation protein HypD [Synergistaceae bacterium]
MLRRLGELVSETGRAVTFMEVCGTHTVAIFRSGLRSLLPEGLRLLSGPGCPVCVTDQREIDMAVSLAETGRIVLTYGDMMRVPGSSNSLAGMKSAHARVEVVTSAMQAIKTAKDNPGSEVVFLGVGFETTSPGTAIAIKQAHSHGLRNFSVLCLHKTVPPAMRALCSNTELKIDGFILPGNVTVVTGIYDYAFLTDELHKAAAVAGFEPEEILAALVDLSRQTAAGRFGLSAYRLNDVPKAGNPAARKILSEVFETCDTVWRGLGEIPGSGLRVAKDYSRFDAAERFGLNALTALPAAKNNNCRCGEILTGLLTPPECELYGTACTPMNPIGPCMVSGEGTCGAWHRFNR